MKEGVTEDLSVLLFKIVHLTKRGNSVSSLSTPVTSCKSRMVAVLYWVKEMKMVP